MFPTVPPKVFEHVESDSSKNRSRHSPVVDGGEMEITVTRAGQGQQEMSSTERLSPLGGNDSRRNTTDAVRKPNAIGVE